MDKRFGIIVCAFALISIPSASASPGDCRAAIDRYNSAISDVSDALRGYAACVSNSGGHDDCASEFSRLRSAQDDFESAVEDYEGECS